MPIGDLFAPMAAGLGAQDAFSDRVTELTAFDDSIRSYMTAIGRLEAAEWSAQDLNLPRNNILVFYGVGGIGKTSLLDRLQDRIADHKRNPRHWPSEPGYRLSGTKFVTAAIDMDSNRSSPIEATLLTLRAALAFESVRADAFDMFLAVYWRAAHPQEKLDSFVAEKHGVGKLLNQLGLQDHVESAVSDVLDSVVGVSTIGMTAVRTASEIVRLASNRRIRRAALSTCELLEELLQAPMNDESLSYAPYLLAWDIERRQKKDQLGIVVFIDTVEALPAGMSAMVERMAWLLPNVLFVLAGRNRLGWTGSYQGSAIIPGREFEWVGLRLTATSEPRQHLVGALSNEDARGFLVDRIGHAASVAVINAIVMAAEGFPLFLDLSVQRFIQILSRRTPVPIEFALSFDVLAVRVLRDLTPTEQYALQACCLFDAFDKELIHRTALTRTAGALNGLFEKSLIQLSGRQTVVYRLHTSLRQALLAAHDLGEAQMNYTDWRTVGERAIGALKARLHDSIGYEQNFYVLQLFQIAVSLEIEDPDLVNIAELLVTATNWQAEWRVKALHFTDKTSDSSHNWVSALAAALTIVMGRQSRPRSDVAHDLDAILLNCPRTGTELDLVRYFLAESLRDVGDVERADSIVAELIQAGGVWGLKALHAHVHLLRRRGAFRTCSRVISENRHSLQHADRLTGDLHWTQANFSESMMYYEMAAKTALTKHSTGEAATCWASHAFASSWLEPLEARRSIVLSDEVLQGKFHSFTYLMNVLAEINIYADDAQSAERCFDLLVQESRRLQQSSLTAYAHLARAFGGAVRNDGEIVAESLSNSRSVSSTLQFTYIHSIIGRWAGIHSQDNLEWLDPDVLDRWAVLPALRRGREHGRLH